MRCFDYDLVVTYDEIVDMSETKSDNSNGKKNKLLAYFCCFISNCVITITDGHHC